MNHGADVVARNLRNLREGRGLSLEQLAGLTGVSKSMLRQIENGASSPTIATIWKIANGLRVSFTALLRKPGVDAEVRSFKQEEPLVEAEGGLRVYPLVHFTPEQALESFYMEIDPGTRYTGEPHAGNSQEYLFLSAGRLEVSVEEQHFAVSAGEFIRFAADRPHTYQNTGEEMVALILQISYLG